MIYALLAILSAALFGAAAPLSKALLASFTPFQLAGVLYLGVALATAPLALRRRHTQPWHMNRRNVLRLSGAILCGGVLAPLFLLLGLKAATATSVSLWLPLELVATSVVGRLFFRDHLGRYGWVGMFGVFVASVLLSIGEGGAGPRAGTLILAACICWGFDNNFTSLIDGITPAQSTFWKGLAAGTINLGIGLSIHAYEGTPEGALEGLLVGAVSYGASIVLYITAAQNIGAARGQMFFATSPFFGVVLSAALLGEAVSAVQAASILLLAGSLLLVFRDRHAHRHTHEVLEHEHSHRHDDGHHEHVHHQEHSGGRHSHRHAHTAITHAHPHWPDLHHRHRH